MNKIDTSNWKKFKMSDLNFKNYHGKRIKQQDRQDGDTIFITAGKENQGVVGTIGNKVDIWHSPITVDMFGNSFYHDYDCFGDDNVYAFINDDLNKYHKWFISSIINAENNVLFSFGDQFRQDNADALVVLLPATDKGEPDWDYMEEYMKNVETSVRNSLEKLQSAKECKNKIDIVEWKEYFINDLFDFEGIKGDIQAPKVGDGEYALVSSGTTNNGICKYIEEQKSSNLFDENKITIDMFGKAFFQTQKFYSVAHARVNVLTPHMSLNKYNGCFIASVIEALTLPKFQFNDMCSQKALKKEKIKLPSKFNIKTGKYEPDLEYMENFMKDVEKKAKERMNSLI